MFKILMLVAVVFFASLGVFILFAPFSLLMMWSAHNAGASLSDHSLWMAAAFCIPLVLIALFAIWGFIAKIRGDRERIAKIGF